MYEIENENKFWITWWTILALSVITIMSVIGMFRTEKVGFTILAVLGALSLLQIFNFYVRERDFWSRKNAKNNKKENV